MLLWYILAFCICLERGLKMPNNKVEKLCKKKKKMALREGEGHRDSFYS